MSDSKVTFFQDQDGNTSSAMRQPAASPTVPSGTPTWTCTKCDATGQSWIAKHCPVCGSAQLRIVAAAPPVTREPDSVALVVSREEYTALNSFFSYGATRGNHSGEAVAAGPTPGPLTPFIDTMSRLNARIAELFYTPPVTEAPRTQDVKRILERWEGSRPAGCLHHPQSDCSCRFNSLAALASEIDAVYADTLKAMEARAESAEEDWQRALRRVAELELRSGGAEPSEEEIARAVRQYDAAFSVALVSLPAGFDGEAVDRFQMRVALADFVAARRSPTTTEPRNG